MKPLKIVMQAFGPYPNREEVDFEDLSKAGIFLIKGPTGSGKTTIFDAMSMALYGKSTVEEDKLKSGRNNLEVWRCNQAKWETETLVEFTFTAGNNTYQFIRRLVPKRLKLDPVFAVNVMDEDGIFRALDDCKKEAELNNKAEELIGLNSNQFRQVVLLPQGKFERFLTADSATKEEILSKLFDAGAWDRYAQSFFNKIDAMRKKLIDEKNEVDITLKSINSSFEELDHLAEYLKGRREYLDELEKAYAAFDPDKKKEALENDKKLSEIFNRLHQLERLKDSLAIKKDEISNKQIIYDKAVKAEELRNLISLTQDYEADILKRENELSHLKTEIETAEIKESKSKARLDEHIKSSIVNECNEKIGLLNSKRALYESMDKLRKASEDALNSKNKAKINYQNKKSEADNQKIKAEELLKSYNGSEMAARDLRNRYYADIYGEIADELRLDEGKPCPVCGNTSYVNLAPKREDSVTKAMVDEADLKSDNDKRKWEEAEHIRADLNKDLDRLKDEYDEAEAYHKESLVRYEEAAKSLMEGINNTKELEDRIGEINKAVNSYNECLNTLTDDYNKKHEYYQKLTEKQSNLLKELQKVKDKYIPKDEELKKAFSLKGYENADEVKEDLLADEGRESLFGEITAYHTRVKTNAEEIANQLELTKNLIEPLESDFALRQKEIDNMVSDYTRNKSLVSSEIKALSAKHEELSRKMKHYSENILRVESDIAFAKKLRGDTGIGLQRYVLGIMFNQIIGEANQMLKKVHGGRYQLSRTDEKGSGNKRGLELVVHDNRRPDNHGRQVSSLSGGEKFLVSLSLSIGMSTIAQKSGLKIEALFIDEGFGTLDDSSIQDAMDILESVQKSSGMIGIISHVSTLENTIPRHVEIIKTEDGSYIK